MSSRKLPADGEMKNNFQERNVFKARSNEKKMSSNKGFFIKPSKNINQKNKTIASSEASFRKKEKQVRSPQDTNESKTIKQPFDKKAWRFKRYSKKYKLQQWKDERKTHILRGYDKSLNENNTTQLNFEAKHMDYAKNSTLTETNPEKELSLLNVKLSNKRNQVDETTKDNKTENLKRKALREEARKEYKKKKLEKFKKLNRKTKKGQPVMKGRIEVLLEEIQNSLGH